MASRHIQITCPRCHRSGLKIRPEYLGQAVQCKHCGEIFTSVLDGDDRGPGPAAPPGPPGAAPPLPRPPPAEPGERPGTDRERAQKQERNLLKDVARLGRKLEAVRGERAEALRRADELTRQVEADALALRAAQARCDESEARATGLAGRFARLTEELESARGECDGLRGAAASREAETASALDTERARLESDVRAALAEGTRLRNQADGLGRELEAATARLRETDGHAAADRRRFEAEAATLRGELETARQAHGDAERQAGGARDELGSRAAELATRLDQIAQELETERAARARLAQDADALRGEVETTRRALDDAERLVAGARDEAGGLGRDLEVATARLREADNDRQRFKADADALRGELEAARRAPGDAERNAVEAGEAGRLAAGLREELDSRAAGLAARLDQAAVELVAERAGRARLAQDADALRGELEAARRALRDAERNAEEAGRLADGARNDAEQLGRDLEAATARLREADDDRRRSDADTAMLRGELEAARQALGDAERRAAELRGEVDRLGREHQAGGDEWERAATALRRERDDSRSREAAGWERATALGESMADLEQRLASALDDLSAAVERAESAEANAKAASLRPATAGEDDPAPAADDRPETIEDLTRRLGEARQANQRLSALLGVFGVPADSAPRPPVPNGAAAPGPEAVWTTNPQA